MTKYSSYLIHTEYLDSVDNKEELDTKDDAATAKLGAEWQIPSSAQIRELIDERYTAKEWTALNTVYGVKITSEMNGNSIFLPAAGVRAGTELQYTDSYESEGYYWSRKRCGDCVKADDLYFSSKGAYIGSLFWPERYWGKSIRPVRKK